MARLLIIDSHPETGLILKRILEKKLHDVTIIQAYAEAPAIIQSMALDLVIVDLKQTDISTDHLSDLFRCIISSSKLIVLSSSKDICIGIGLMKLGAKDYLLKPINTERLHKVIMDITSAGDQNHDKPIKVKNKVMQVSTFISGKSASFQNILHQIKKVSPTNYSVIIYGESGSGKELVAQEIHKQSKRHSMPFIAIDCGALSKELASSDLFGHEKGAFTGAYNQKIGNFELANGGTLFLDEVANLPYEVQVSLLRVVQQRKFRRLGGTKDIEFNARIIVATNEPLWDSIQAGSKHFREDLYHRFNEFSIHVPPLRERKEDIPVLATYFLALANQDLNKNILGFTEEVHKLFNTHVWDGNIRELNNTIRRAALLVDANWIDASLLPFEITTDALTKINEPPISDQPSFSLAPNHETFKTVPLSRSIKNVATDAEYQLIVKVLADAKYNKAKAARILNIDRKTLYNKLEEFSNLTSA
jgi:two-component system response regulator HydG